MLTCQTYKEIGKTGGHYAAENLRRPVAASKLSIIHFKYFNFRKLILWTPVCLDPIAWTLNFSESLTAHRTRRAPPPDRQYVRLSTDLHEGAPTLRSRGVDLFAKMPGIWEHVSAATKAGIGRIGITTDEWNRKIEAELYRHSDGATLEMTDEEKLLVAETLRAVCEAASLPEGSWKESARSYFAVRRREDSGAYAYWLYAECKPGSNAAWKRK